MKNRDLSQQKVLTLTHGYNIVLAPPGCGKTDILAERIAIALQNGTRPDDILCVTFTNRAARSMKARVQATIPSSADQIFIGTLHRFCSRFLFENNLVPMNSGILDDDDIDDILLGIRKTNTKNDRVHKLITLYQHANFPMPAIKDWYDKQIDKQGVPNCYEQALIWEQAQAYNEYKETFSLLDFDDLLCKTYVALYTPGTEYKKYSWIQVDEIQDLNSIQIGIIDALTDTSKDFVVLYLGDEQQSIYSFMGADTNVLNKIKKRCGTNIFSFSKNYRSPRYLLDIFNTYAECELHIAKEFLPNTVSERSRESGDTRIIHMANRDKQPGAIYLLINTFQRYTGTRTAVLVPSNVYAEEIANTLEDHGYDIFKISGKDIFTEALFQTIFAHFSLVLYETNILSCAKVLRHMPTYKASGGYYRARHAARLMRQYKICFDDIIMHPNSSYIKDFSAIYDKTIVLFDTETTGLDIHADDIIQIAAIRLRSGTILDTLNIFLETNRAIPEMLGDIPNPLFALYATKPKYTRAEGLTKFLEYIQGADCLCAHNAVFDTHILEENVRRDLQRQDWKCPATFDTLKISKLLFPRLASYKLEFLLRHFGLAGINSHNAMDDVLATKSLLDLCFTEAGKALPGQDLFLKTNAAVVDGVRTAYAVPYRHTKEALYSTRSLLAEIEWLAEYYKEKGIVHVSDTKNAIKKREAVFRLFEKILKDDGDIWLSEQIAKHILEFTGFKEADIYENDIVQNTVFVSTVHKAKGLEFENVIVTDAVEDYYPFFKNKRDEDKVREDARKLYVAISRARERLVLLSYKENKGYAKGDSRFLRAIQSYFESSTM